MYEKLSDLKSTCQAVKNIIERERLSQADSQDNYKSWKESLAGGTQQTTEDRERAVMGGVGRGYGIHDDIDDLGCGVHSYCSYCIDDCSGDKMANYIVNNYDYHGEGDIGMTVTGAKLAVVFLDRTCEDF